MNPFLAYPHCSCKLSITHQALWVTQRCRRTTAETSMLQHSIKKQGFGVGREGEWSLEALGEDLFVGRGVGLGRGGRLNTQLAPGSAVEESGGSDAGCGPRS